MRRAVVLLLVVVAQATARPPEQLGLRDVLAKLAELDSDIAGAKGNAVALKEAEQARADYVRALKGREIEWPVTVRLVSPLRPSDPLPKTKGKAKPKDVGLTVVPAGEGVMIPSYRATLSAEGLKAMDEAAKLAEKRLAPIGRKSARGPLLSVLTMPVAPAEVNAVRVGDLVVIRAAIADAGPPNLILLTRPELVARYAKAGK